MKKILGFVISGLLMLGGCSVKTVPVLHDTEVHDTMAITTSTNQVEKSDSSYKETITEKTLPADSTKMTISRDGYDSLRNALKALPSSVTRTIYVKDPKGQAVLKVMLDSLNRLVFTCISTERTYQEKLTASYKTISKLSESESTLRHTLQEKETIIKKLNESFWVKVTRFFDNGIWFMLIIMIIFTVVNFLIKRKS